jgi:hypothetical protein
MELASLNRRPRSNLERRCWSTYSMSALVPILLQKSVCIAERKFSEPQARRADNHLGDYFILMNAQAVSVTGLRLHRPAMAVCFVF